MGVKGLYGPEVESCSEGGPGSEGKSRRDSVSIHYISGSSIDNAIPPCVHSGALLSVGFLTS